MFNLINLGFGSFFVEKNTHKHFFISFLSNIFSVARDQFWLRRGIMFWLRRRSFFGEYGVGLGFELFALVIKPGQ